MFWLCITTMEGTEGSSQYKGTKWR